MSKTFSTLYLQERAWFMYLIILKLDMHFYSIETIYHIKKVSYKMKYNPNAVEIKKGKWWNVSRV